MTVLAHDRYCDEIAHQVERLRTVVTSGADLSATVPTCPEWSLEDLVRHMGGALRWVDTLVRTRAQENVPPEQVPLGGGPEERGDAAALDKWLAETGELVVGALREAGPDTAVWAWAGTMNSGFWARRMVHEITVHRADAVLTAGLPYEVAPDVAADAVDEWLQIVEWAQRNLPRDPAKDLRRPGSSIHLHATDADPALHAEWLIELGEEGVVWRRGHEKATVALRGPLTSLLLAFYRRLPLDSPGLEVLGEREVLEFWLERATFG
ncbi:maleylpyruvate isomerase family mycothiol-dependent enzyme [Streptomyces filipinensis]|uniref:maleylpyruvate isomerase family mycothiol-dependent enzyme n=1 Tax=Streptomyces filipinensis TaxID=66887 RepID=UPI00177E857F|nr:maleylpyruvate isomerase family mycothiol-dependent enzyme [Streptomyces filipinensis]